MRYFFWLSNLVFILSGLPARAEYRVFLLHIVDPAAQLDLVEVSNLDPVQYVQYHARTATQKVTYTATWMCRGNTAEQNFCPNPKAK